MKHLRVYNQLVYFGLALLCHSALGFMSNYYDPYPLASAEYPWAFLSTNYKERTKGMRDEKIEEKTHFSFTPFGQRATTGTDTLKNDITNLGDLHGRWSMGGLLYGAIPNGQAQPGALTLAAAQTYQDGQNLSYENYRDKNNNLGFFSIPLKYRKTGIRFEWAVRCLENFVLSVQAGIADIKQTTKPFQDQSSSATTLADIYGNPGAIPDLKADVLTFQSYLMDPTQAQQIFDQLGYNTRNFTKLGAEDVFFSLTWRQHFFVNTGKNSNPEWSSFSIMPFVTAKGCLGFGEKKDPAQLFGVPFGNNGHHAIQVSAGLTLDFAHTVELNAKIGGTHFFKRNIAEMYVPTSKQQSGIYPYATDVSYEPGRTWFFTVGCASQHFLDKLSMYTEYYYIQHSKDKISLLTPDTAFIPSVLEDTTYFNVQGVSIGMSYDLSPYISVGGVWQCPILQRNAYKTNTITLNLLITI